jgi:hypothetical protein
MTEKEMQIMLGKHFGIKNICIPNVLMTGEYRPEIEKLESLKKSSKMYEADLIYITKSGYLTEVEIKVDINDFRSDFNKKSISFFSARKCFILCFPRKAI